MARPGRPERNRAAQSFRQLRRFHHAINSDDVFGTHKGLGLFTGLDLRNQSVDFLKANFGKAGAYYYWISRGVDDREVRADRIRKSVGAETTFFNDLTEFEAMRAELQPLIDKVWRHCEDKAMRGRTVSLKVKFADFELISRSRTLAGAVSSHDELANVSAELLKAVFPTEKGEGRQAARRFDFRFCAYPNGYSVADCPALANERRLTVRLDQKRILGCRAPLRRIDQ